MFLNWSAPGIWSFLFQFLQMSSSFQFILFSIWSAPSNQALVFLFLLVWIVSCWGVARFHSGCWGLNALFGIKVGCNFEHGCKGWSSNCPQLPPRCLRKGQPVLVESPRLLAERGRTSAPFALPAREGASRRMGWLGRLAAGTLRAAGPLAASLPCLPILLSGRAFAPLCFAHSLEIKESLWIFPSPQEAGNQSVQRKNVSPQANSSKP